MIDLLTDIEGTYIVRLQSRVPKFVGGDKNHAQILQQRRAISVRVKAKNYKDAEKKALQKKATLSHTPAWRVLSVKRLIKKSET